MLKHAFCSVNLTLALVSLAPACFAVPIASVPNPKRANGGWVTDMAGMLTPETEKELNRQITSVEAKNSSELAVVTVPDVSPAASPKAFATELFNTWGIGKRGQDNGVLVLVSKGDRRVEVITGKGLTTLLPTNQVSKILQQEVTPKFKQRQFDAGVLGGTKALIAQVNRYQPRSQSQSPQIGSVQLQPQTVATSNNFDHLAMAMMVGLAAGTASVGGMLLYRQLKRQPPAARSSASSNSDWSSTDQSSWHSSSGNDFSSSGSNDSSSGDYSSSSDSSSSSSDFGGGSTSDSGSGDSW